MPVTTQLEIDGFVNSTAYTDLDNRLTIVEGSDHDPVTLGTANGLSLSLQELSLALATITTPGAMSDADKVKLDGIETGAQVNTVDSVNSATGVVVLTTDEVSQGLTNFYFSNGLVSASPDVAANTAARHDAVTLGTSNGLSLSTQELSLALATPSVAGAMSAADKTKLDSLAASSVASVNTFTGVVVLDTDDIAEGVTNLYYTEPRVSANTDVAANTAARHDAVTIGTASGLSLSVQEISLALATTSTDGAMSAADKTKLDGIATGAQVNTVDSVNAQTGVVVLDTDDIAEGGTNLYYTEPRVSANTDVAANTAARHDAVTIGTANGLSLSTQEISLALATTSTAGAMSATDKTDHDQLALGYVPVTGQDLTVRTTTSTSLVDVGPAILISKPANYTNVSTWLLLMTFLIRDTGSTTENLTSNYTIGAPNSKLIANTDYTIFCDDQAPPYLYPMDFLNVISWTSTGSLSVQPQLAAETDTASISEINYILVPLTIP